jgi:hypothetical protein
MVLSKQVSSRMLAGGMLQDSRLSSHLCGLSSPSALLPPLSGVPHSWPITVPAAVNGPKSSLDRKEEISYLKCLQVDGMYTAAF